MSAPRSQTLPKVPPPPPPPPPQRQPRTAPPLTTSTDGTNDVTLSLRVSVPKGEVGPEKDDKRVAVPAPPPLAHAGVAPSPPSRVSPVLSHAALAPLLTASSAVPSPPPPRGVTPNGSSKESHAPIASPPSAPVASEAAAVTRPSPPLTKPTSPPLADSPVKRTNSAASLAMLRRTTKGGSTSPPTTATNTAAATTPPPNFVAFPEAPTTPLIHTLPVEALSPPLTPTRGPVTGLGDGTAMLALRERGSILASTSFGNGGGGDGAVSRMNSPFTGSLSTTSRQSIVSFVMPPEGDGAGDRVGRAGRVPGLTKKGFAIPGNFPAAPKGALVIRPRKKSPPGNALAGGPIRGDAAQEGVGAAIPSPSSFRDRIQQGRATSRKPTAVRRRDKSAGSARAPPRRRGGGNGSTKDGGRGGAVGSRRSSRALSPGSSMKVLPMSPASRFVTYMFVTYFHVKILAIVQRSRAEAHFLAVTGPRAAFVIQCCWRRYRQRQRVRVFGAVSFLQPWLRFQMRKRRRRKEQSALLLQRLFRGEQIRSLMHFLYGQMKYNQALNVVRRFIMRWEAQITLRQLKFQRDERNVFLERCHREKLHMLRNERTDFIGLTHLAARVLGIRPFVSRAEYVQEVTALTGVAPVVVRSPSSLKRTGGLGDDPLTAAAGKRRHQSLGLPFPGELSFSSFGNTVGQMLTPITSWRGPAMRLPKSRRACDDLLGSPNSSNSPPGSAANSWGTPHSFSAEFKGRPSVTVDNNSSHHNSTDPASKQNPHNTSTQHTASASPGGNAPPANNDTGTLEGTNNKNGGLVGTAWGGGWIPMHIADALAIPSAVATTAQAQHFLQELFHPESSQYLDVVMALRGTTTAGEITSEEGPLSTTGGEEAATQDSAAVGSLGDRVVGVKSNTQPSLPRQPHGAAALVEVLDMDGPSSADMPREGGGPHDEEALANAEEFGEGGANGPLGRLLGPKATANASTTTASENALAILPLVFEAVGGVAPAGTAEVACAAGVTGGSAGSVNVAGAPLAVPRPPLPPGRASAHGKRSGGIPRPPSSVRSVHAVNVPPPSPSTLTAPSAEVGPATAADSESLPVVDRSPEHADDIRTAPQAAEAGAGTSLGSGSHTESEHTEAHSSNEVSALAGRDGREPTVAPTPQQSAGSPRSGHPLASGSARDASSSPSSSSSSLDVPNLGSTQCQLNEDATTTHPTPRAKKDIARVGGRLSQGDNNSTSRHMSHVGRTPSSSTHHASALSSSEAAARAAAYNAQIEEQKRMDNDGVLAAYVVLLCRTESIERKALEQELLLSYAAFLKPVRLVSYAICLSQSLQVPPFYAPLLLSFSDFLSMRLAAKFFVDEQKQRMTLLDEYDALPLEHLSRPLFSNAAESRRRALVSVVAKSADPFPKAIEEEARYYTEVMRALTDRSQHVQEPRLPLQRWMAESAIPAQLASTAMVNQIHTSTHDHGLQDGPCDFPSMSSAPLAVGDPTRGTSSAPPTPPIEQEDRSETQAPAATTDASLEAQHPLSTGEGHAPGQRKLTVKMTPLAHVSGNDGAEAELQLQLLRLTEGPTNAQADSVRGGSEAAALVAPGSLASSLAHPHPHPALTTPRRRRRGPPIPLLRSLDPHIAAASKHHRPTELPQPADPHTLQTLPAARTLTTVDAHAPAPSVGLAASQPGVAHQLPPLPSTLGVYGRPPPQRSPRGANLVSTGGAPWMDSARQSPSMRSGAIASSRGSAGLPLAFSTSSVSFRVPNMQQQQQQQHTTSCDSSSRSQQVSRLRSRQSAGSILTCSSCTRNSSLHFGSEADLSGENGEETDRGIGLRRRSESPTGTSTTESDYPGAARVGYRRARDSVFGAAVSSASAASPPRRHTVGTRCGSDTAEEPSEERMSWTGMPDAMGSGPIKTRSVAPKQRREDEAVPPYRVPSPDPSLSSPLSDSAEWDRVTRLPTPLQRQRVFGRHGDTLLGANHQEGKPSAGEPLSVPPPHPPRPATPPSPPPRKRAGPSEAVDYKALLATEKVDAHTMGLVFPVLAATYSGRDGKNRTPRRGRDLHLTK